MELGDSCLCIQKMLVNRHWLEISTIWICMMKKENTKLGIQFHIYNYICRCISLFEFWHEFLLHRWLLCNADRSLGAKH